MPLQVVSALSEVVALATVVQAHAGLVTGLPFAGPEVVLFHRSRYFLRL